MQKQREKLDELEVGKAAEYLVVADLILRGYRAYLTDQGLPYDVVVDVDGKLLRVQVKSTRCLRAIPQRCTTISGYIFHVRRAGKAGHRKLKGNEADLFAFVALDIRVIAYMPFDPRDCIILRPPGSKPYYSARRLGNIDQFPIEIALAHFKLDTVSFVAPPRKPKSLPLFEQEAALGAERGSTEAGAGG